MATEQRLISLDEAIARIKDDGILGNGYSDDERIDDVIDMLECCHEVEARPVVHGRWENPSKYGLSTMMDKLGNVCSACASYCDNRFNYCPSCGADMRERKDDDQ